MLARPSIPTYKSDKLTPLLIIFLTRDYAREFGFYAKTPQTTTTPVGITLQE